MKEFVGYDTVVMNWLISLYGGRGFLYGVHNNELFNLNYAAEFIESTEVRVKRLRCNVELLPCHGCVRVGLPKMYFEGRVELLS